MENKLVICQNDERIPWLPSTPMNRRADQVVGLVGYDVAEVSGAGAFAAVESALQHPGIIDDDSIIFCFADSTFKCITYGFLKILSMKRLWNINTRCT